MNVTPLKVAKQVPEEEVANNFVTNSRSLLRELLIAGLPVLFSRAVVVGIIVFVCGLQIQAIPALGGQHFNLEFVGDRQQLQAKIAHVLSAADVAWYRGIAEHGYDAAPARDVSGARTTVAHNWVFFPLYPLLLKGLALIGADRLAGELLLQAGLLFAALVLLYRWALTQGLTTSQAERSLWLLCWFPTSYFLSAPMTESPFLFLLVATLLAVDTRRFVAAGCCMGLLAICRPTGLLMLPGFFLLLLERKAFASWRGFAALALAPLGMSLFMLHLYLLTGDPLSFIANQANWGRGENFATLVATGFQVGQGIVLPWNFVLLNLATAGLAIAAAVTLAQRRHFGLALVVALPVGVCLTTGTLQSLSRFVLTLVPMYLILSIWCERIAVERAVLAVFAGLLAMMTVGYALQVTAALC